jgi:hypothetical protein
MLRMDCHASCIDAWLSSSDGRSIRPQCSPDTVFPITPAHIAPRSLWYRPHGTLCEQEQAHGLIVKDAGGPEGLASKEGLFLVWEDPKKKGVKLLSLVNNHGHIEDNLITRDSDGAFSVPSSGLLIDVVWQWSH